VLTCPHCKRPLTEPDVTRQICPHCGQAVASGQATLEMGPGQATIELPNAAKQHDSTVTTDSKATLVDSRVAQTIDSADLPPAAGDSRLARTLESSDIQPAAGDSRFSQTLDSAELGSGSHAGTDQTLDSADVASASPSNLDTSVGTVQTIDSVTASGSRGSSSAKPSSPDDVDRRLRQVWGSQMAAARPQMTMRGSESRGSEPEENSTLIIRERNLRTSAAASPVSLADYDLLNVLGEGGMGVVYNARQASIDREVAVKMLKPDMSASSAQRRKFLSEAAVTGELDHPNIVPIYDLGQNAEGALFYSMKKVTGTPWSKVIGEKSLLDNLTILMKVADAVAFAHARGVVHRDLKPENVMLGDFGEVLVLDWGLAVATEGHRPTPNVSAAFNIAGTPAYMAPELAFGPMDAIGRHSDVYLLGAILYECITGHAPHHGKNARECLKAAANNQIVPTDKRGELVEIAMQAMATDPKRRPASVQAFQAAIRDYQAHSESIALCERAETGLTQAAQTNDYQDYSRTLFAFEEAVQLWPGNDAAKVGVSRARLHYAACALNKSDFDLGLSLIDAQDPTHESVARQLHEAKAERDARLHRLRRARQIMAALAALVFLAISIGVCVASYLAVVAKESENRAVASAGVAKQKEAEARQSEIKAKENESTAIREADRAHQAEEEAKARREEAVASAYTALIAMAAARIDENSFDQAKAALEQCDEKHRGWEWRRLMHVVSQGYVTQLPLPSRAEALAVSPSGNLVATGSLDGVVRLWDQSRRVLVVERNFGEKSARVTALAFHPQDDRWLVVGLSEGPRPLIAWNRESDELRAPTEEHRHTAGVVQATFSADGKSLVTASHDRTARLWDWESFIPRTFAGHTGTVWSAALSADGRKVATASEDGTVRIWDTTTAMQLRSAAGQRIPFAQHAGPVYAVVFLPVPHSGTPNGQPASRTSAETAYYLASGGYDKRVLLWQTDRLVPFDIQDLVSDRPVAESPYQELKGHSAAIRALALSSDGTRLASAAADHTLRIWQTLDSHLVRRGALLKELRGHAGPVYAAAFAPTEANLVLSTGYDERVRLWRIDQYAEQQQMPGLALRGHANAVLSARFSPNSESIVTASLDRTARRWNSQTGAGEQTFREGHAYLASRVIFFKKNRKLLTAGGDGTVRIWDLDKQAELRVLDRTGYRAAAALAPDEHSIITGSSDVLDDSSRPHCAIVWDADTGERLRTLVGPHKAPLTCVAYSPAAERPLVLTGDDNGVFQLWHPATGEALGPRTDQHASPLVAAEFGGDGLSLVTADAGGRVFRWNVADPSRIMKVHEYPHPAGVQSLALTADGHLLTGGADGRLRLFEATGHEPLWIAESLATGQGTFVSSPAPTMETIRAVAVGKDAVRGVAVAVAVDVVRGAAGADSEQEYLRLFELDVGQRSFREVAPVTGDGARCLIDLTEQAAAGWSAAISPDAAQIATVGRDEARLFGRDGNELAGFRPHQDLTFAEFSHTGELILTASLDSSVRIWDAASGQARMTLDEHSAGPLGGHSKPVNCAVFSPDDRHILTGSEDGSVRQWELASMRVLRVIQVSDKGVSRVAISHDGQTLFTASRPGQAAIYRLADPAEPLHRMVGHASEILDLCLSSDERWIATASADNTARLWDAATGQELLVLKGHASEVTSVALLSDRPGLRVLTGSNDKTAKVWAVTGLDSQPVAKELLALKGHTRGLTSVAFAPDGRAALTAAADGLTILWPAAILSSP
jgi:WD40 repeat protein/serine/threonine protein kinase